MSRITYSISPPAPHAVLFKKSDSAFLEIEIQRAEGGSLRIGDKSYKISHGTAKIPKSELKNGTFAPLYIAEGQTVILPELQFFGGEVIPYSSAAYTALLSQEIVELRERLLAAEDALEKIKTKVYGTQIF